MPTSYIKFERCLNVTKRSLAALLLLSFVLSPVVPFAKALAQGTDQENINQETVSEPDPQVEDTATTSEPSPEEIQADPASAPSTEQEPVLEAPTEVVVPIEEAPLPKTKFKKDSLLSMEEQLAKVRQHIIDNELPQAALGRLNTFESKQAAGIKGKSFIKKTLDFISGNTDEAKIQKEAERLIKSEPFKVEEFKGKINTVSVGAYEEDFSGAKEQGNWIQKVRNLIENGTFFNSDFDKTEKNKKGIVSFLFGPEEAIADASNDPADYLDEGGEIKFTQVVQDQADALDNDALKLLNFVLNDVDYIPYYGSKKGADATLLEKAGNDTDKASLLIGMLRYSDIPARYRHVDAKIGIDEMNALLGMPTAMRSAELLSLQNIPYALYVSTEDEPLFFVIEHTYVEAYIPYGFSRGTDPSDGGISQWVPMDPTITEYYYEQPFDVVKEMTADGFDIETFFGDYLNGDYGTDEPIEAFKSKIEDYLASSGVPGYFDDGLTYEDAKMKVWSRNDDLDFIPGSLPFEISADLNTYDFIPSSLRHTIEFTVTEDSSEVLNHTAYVSDLADREVLLTYEAATQTDQDIIDGFDTIYDVVPLSLVDVKPKIKVAGSIVATGTATSTMGVSHRYKMEFRAPIRDIGDPVDTELTKTVEKGIVTGTTDGIAFNTDRVVPFANLPDAQGETGSFLSNQLLYKTAVDYLLRLETTHRELAAITGRDFVNVATKASISNGAEVTYSSGDPYSFEWMGLRIDASAKVRGFHRFDEEISNNRAEFMAIFGLQSSQDESDIFEDNFGVESVATVKGLKLVADGEFSPITLEKITDANEGDIDSLSISSGMKTAFHDAISEGMTIYTPSAPVTYENWEGLFYITVDFDEGDGTYAIGEGLNGGYTVTTVAAWPGGLPAAFIKVITLGSLTADIITPANNSTYSKGTIIPWQAEYDGPLGLNWTENLAIGTAKAYLGVHTLRTGYGTTDTVNVTINSVTLGGEGNKSTIDKSIIDAVAAAGLDPDFAPVLKLLMEKETKGVAYKMRYEPCVDKTQTYGNSKVNQHPYSAWRLGGNGYTQGAQVPSLKSKHGKTPQEMIKAFSDYGFVLQDADVGLDGVISIFDAWSKNDGVQNYTENNCDSTDIISTLTQPAQLLISSSYGAAQVVYAYHATEFDSSTSGEAKDIWGMFGQDANAKSAAVVLKSAWDSRSSFSGDSCNSGDRLWQTLATYNGGSHYTETKPQAYASDICTQFRAGRYQAITQ